MIVFIINLMLYSPEVWGSVSDWVYIIISAATLLFLIKTFRSQLAVQQMQLQITAIENERYRTENIPSFEAEIFEDQPRQPEDACKMLISLGFGLKEGECRNIRLSVHSNMAKELRWESLLGNFNYLTTGGAHLIDVYITKETAEPAYIFPVALDFEFEDMVGNHYTQGIHCMIRRSGKHQVYTTAPWLVQEKKAVSKK